MPRYIKVFSEMDLGNNIKKEWLHAEPLGNNTARLMNIPLNLKYGIRDVVEYDPNDDNRIVRVISRGTRSFGGSYESTGDADIDSHNKVQISNYLKQFTIECEFLTPRLFTMAAPLNMSKARVKEICYGCPVPFNVFSS